MSGEFAASEWRVAVLSVGFMSTYVVSAVLHALHSFPKLSSLQHCTANALQEYCSLMQFDTAGANAVGFGMGKGWARQGHLAIEHCTDTVWALQGCVAMALQGYCGVCHCRVPAPYARGAT